ncbi:glycoside hydrolase family 3 protein [Streptomyces sp. VRA16 Mangrove soil]|uniref:glycoside hydrolase family 3 protein n=1 Tax=Streptomyces sp. VRA16 Mangrove soil TaxID=2817434 RepID=UPI001A9E484B|nr:glycoside hydrolase family 3 protein [Streptomyces sp. VRA16 Mangrove soil]MBO1330246.1 glycoside hydrolase family 3 C-terminal domain-containing protein [Streptomyces sp. VRA16 Mangrove soil]
MTSRRRALAGMAGAAWALSTARPSAAGSVAETARALAGRMTVEQKVGQLFLIEVAGRDAHDVDEAAAALNRQRYGVATPAEVVRTFAPGGVIYFSARGDDNLGSPAQLARLSQGLQEASTAVAGVPLIISVDQEGGVVSRMPTPPATPQPGNMALGATWSTAQARRAYEITAAELSACGITADHAPVADVNVNPANPVIGIRSFGSEPRAVAAFVRAAVQGLHRGGVAATAKHFPGHGDTDTDSHLGLPRITHSRAQLDAIDLPPFRAAIAAGVDMIMTAHISVPALDPTLAPSTMSRTIVTGLLREELGFDGLIVTDALDMRGASAVYPPDKAAVTALAAGVDMLVLSPDLPRAHAAVLSAVRSGRISAARLDASVIRILSHKIRRGLGHGASDPARAERVVGRTAFLAAADAITGRGTTLVKNDDDVLPLCPGTRSVLVTGSDDAAVRSLAAAFGERGHRATPLATGAAPDRTVTEEAVRAAASADLVVVASGLAPADGAQGGTAHVALVRALLASGRPVVVIGVRNPYDINRFPEAPLYLATYGSGPRQLDHAVQVVLGEHAPHGRLPVAVPAAGDPAEVLYPVGHGLRF